MKIMCIYIIKCPETENVKYVGMTKNFTQRKYIHEHGYGICVVSEWERGLLKKGLKPIVEILKLHSNPITLPEIELQIMREYLKNGVKLLNTHH